MLRSRFRLYELDWIESKFLPVVKLGCRGIGDGVQAPYL